MRHKKSKKMDVEAFGQSFSDVIALKSMSMPVRQLWNNGHFRSLQHLVKSKCKRIQGAPLVGIAAGSVVADPRIEVVPRPNWGVPILHDVFEAKGIYPGIDVGRAPHFFKIANEVLRHPKSHNVIPAQIHSIEKLGNRLRD